MKLDRNLLRKTGLFGLVSAELVGLTAGGFFLGGLVDDWLNSRPWLSVGFTFLGLTIAIRRLMVVVKKF